jgi:hypothetical protein
MLFFEIKNIFSKIKISKSAMQMKNKSVDATSCNVLRKRQYFRESAFESSFVDLVDTKPEKYPPRDSFNQPLSCYKKKPCSQSTRVQCEYALDFRVILVVVSSF